MKQEETNWFTGAAFTNCNAGRTVSAVEYVATPYNPSAYPI